jgi:hypothetical protein
MSCQTTDISTDISTDIEKGGPPRAGRPPASGSGAADWLSLAAAPTFAVMALLTGVGGGGPLDMLCSASPEASLLTGMVPMYLLMSAFHAAPWLRLLSVTRTAWPRSWRAPP